MKISYNADLRALAKEQKRGLFTLSVAGITAQGMTDEKLTQDMLNALIAYRERCNTTKQQGAAR